MTPALSFSDPRALKLYDPHGWRRRVYIAAWTTGSKDSWASLSCYVKPQLEKEHVTTNKVDLNAFFFNLDISDIHFILVSGECLLNLDYH